jgi:prolyl 4-hydroxylase
MMTKDIPAVWREWIATNLQRGCKVPDMIAAMGQARLDAATAAAWISAVSGKDAKPPARTAAATAGKAYRYEGSRIPTGNTIVLSDRTVKIAMRQSRPDIVLVEDLLSAAECEELISLSQAKLQPSMIVDPSSGAERVIVERSSEGTYFQRGENALVERLDHRIAEFMNWPQERGEGLQILHYHIGGEYKPHYDYFPPQDAGSDPHLATGGQRQATLIIYLNDVEQGGETIFPDTSLSITPRRGSAVYFSYCNSAGQVDPATLHGGAPVLRGEKWIATKWVRERRYG